MTKPAAQGTRFVPHWQLMAMLGLTALGFCGAVVVPPIWRHLHPVPAEVNVTVEGGQDAELLLAVQHLADKRVRAERRLKPDLRGKRVPINLVLASGAVTLRSPVGEETAPSVAEALDKLVPRIADALAGKPRALPPTEGEEAQLRAAGTTSLAALRKVEEAFDVYVSAEYMSVGEAQRLAREAVEADRGWARAHVMLVHSLGTVCSFCKDALQLARRQVDAARDPVGQELLRSLELANDGKFHEAAALLRPLAARSPDDSLLVWTLAQREVISRPDGIVPLLERLHRERPDLQFGADLIVALRSANRAGEVPALIDDWIRRAPESEQGLLTAANWAVAHRDLPRAEQLAERVLLLHGAARPRLVPIASILLATGKVDTAKRLARELLGGDEFERARGLYRLGFAAVLEGRFADAKSHLEAALALARTQGQEGETTQILESLRAIEPLVGQPGDLQRYTSDMVGMYGRLSHPGPLAEARWLDARAKSGGCPPIEPFVAEVADAENRVIVRRWLLRAAAAAKCARCSAAVAAGRSSFEPSARSLYQLGACDEEIGDTKAAREAFEAAETTDFSGSAALSSPYHSILAGYRLSGVLGQLGDPAGSRAALEKFARGWQNASPVPPELSAARRALDLH